MEDQVERLAKKSWGSVSLFECVPVKSTDPCSDKLQQIPKSKRLLIGISGIPGSGTSTSKTYIAHSINANPGKTTLATKVAKRINELHHDHEPGCACGIAVAAFIPMDGYHLSRAQLDAMPDPANAHARRGAAFTFDGDSFLRLVQKLREPLLPESTTLYAPSFDHAQKDPVADDIPITPGMRFLVFEGNYLSLNKSPWKDAASLMDELWFVEVDFERARERLVARHVKAGIVENEEGANKRVTENDLMNGKEIVDERMNVDEIVISKEDEEWKVENQQPGG